MNSAKKSRRIKAIHTKVPGRARFNVSGLRSSPALKDHLESSLSASQGVSKISASTLTGNVLVCYNSGKDLQEISELISGFLDREGPGQGTVLETHKSHGPQHKSRHSPPSNVKDSSPDSQNGTVAKQAPMVTSWHRQSIKRIQEEFETEPVQGLFEDEAERRLSLYGHNTFEESRPRSKWSMFVDQMKSLPTILLGVAGGISLITGGVVDAVVILGVVVTNSIIAVVTENDSNRIIQSLKRFDPPQVTVIREGSQKTISSAAVVPGDLLFLEAGTYVGADSRIIESKLLHIDESTLTGEAQPVLKQSKALRKKYVTPADQKNMAFMGTVVSGGKGKAIVVATGMDTEFGKLRQLLQDTVTPQPPIERNLTQIGEQLVRVWGAVCALVFGLGLLRGFGLISMLRMATSLAAAAVPEGLPAAATSTFALGIKNMRQHHVLIRDLSAVETLGALQTLCFDKTGTLTENRMSVIRIYTGMQQLHVSHGHLYDQEGRLLVPQENQELQDLIEVGILCSDVKINGGTGSEDLELLGSPTENALIRVGIEFGIEVNKIRTRNRLVHVSHRTEKRPVMITQHKDENGDSLYALKGSPCEVLAMCSYHLKQGQILPLTEEEKKRIDEENFQMAGQALRVLGGAKKIAPTKTEGTEETDYIWLGLLGMSDPVRERVPELIHRFHQAGIETIMLTGDQPDTAFAIAKQLDLSHGQPLEVMDCSEISSLDKEEMVNRARKVHVYAKVSPAHKLTIVQALQEAGIVVGMTGDGINDGPALKAADVGIAMGDGGTEVAREVADVVLEKDNLDTLIWTVEAGRTTYNNIKKSVHFFLSTNFSEIMVMFSAVAAGAGTPLNSMQLLWINMVSDIFPGLALSLEPPEPDTLDAPPRDPQAPLFDTKDMKTMIRESAVITGHTLGSYAYGLWRYGVGPRATTLAFHTLTISQLIHALNCRSRSSGLDPRKGLSRNKWLTAALAGTLSLHVAGFFVPGLKRLLHLSPLNCLDVSIIFGNSALSFLVNGELKSRQIQPAVPVLTPTSKRYQEAEDTSKHKEVTMKTNDSLLEMMSRQHRQGDIYDSRI
jgi:Ca2+-transporting ATPase